MTQYSEIKIGRMNNLRKHSIATLSKSKIQLEYNIVLHIILVIIFNIFTLLHNSRF